MLFGGKALAFVEDYRLLPGRLAFSGLGNRRDEFGAAAGLDYSLGGLTAFIELPISSGVFVGELRIGRSKNSLSI